MKRHLAMVLAASLILTGSPVAFGEDITLKPEVRVPELVAAALSQEGAKELLAHPKGTEIAVNARFSDIAGSSDKTSILRMAVEGVISKGTKFRPSDPITRQEALVYLVRMRGNEAAVQQRLATNAGTNPANYYNSLFREYANEAATLGIITPGEEGTLEAAATKEEIALWLSRTINLTPGYGDQNVLNSMSDASAVAPANRAQIEALLSERIMTADQGSKFNPKRTVSRGEMASLLARSTDRLYTARTLASVFGIVSGATTAPRYEGGATISESVYTIKGLDGTVTTVKISDNSKTKQKTGFAVLKNGSVGQSSLLAVGDQIELLTQGGQLILAQVYTDGTVLQRLKADALKDQTLRTYYGTANSRIQENRQLNGRMYKTDRIRIKNHTGQTFDMVVDTDAVTGVRNDIIVQRNGKTGGIDLLQMGDALEYAVKDPNILLYVTANPGSSSQVKGTVRLVEPAGTDGLAHLTVLDYANAIYRYPVAGYADISMNTEFSKLSDLRFGQNVVLYLNNGLITKADAETFTSPGYIAPESKMRIGTVQGVNGSTITLKAEDGSVSQLALEETTVVRKNSQNVSQSSLQPGDRIKAYFDSVDTAAPSRIDVEGKEQLIKGVYKGKIQQVNAAKNELILRDPQVLKNNQWVSTGNYTQAVEMEANAPIYSRGSVVKLSSLKPGYINSDVYIALKDSYGKDIAVKALLKNGSERMHYDRIRTLSQSIQKFELDNRINYAFNDGTILVKDARLVDLTALSEKDSALVISGFSGGNHTAGVINLVPGVASRLKNIYIGTLEEIYSGQFTIRSFYKQNGNEFNPINTQDDITIGYGGDTQIFDVTNDTAKSITPSQLFNGGYSKAENPNSDGRGLPYEHWYAVIVTDENQDAYSIMLRHNAILENQDIDNTFISSTAQREEMDKVMKQVVFTRGTIAGKDSTWNRIKMQDSSDYASFNGQWVPNSTETYVAASDTIILKNNKPVAFENLELGDRINVIKVKGNALVVIVED